MVIAVGLTDSQFLRLIDQGLLYTIVRRIVQANNHFVKFCHLLRHCNVADSFPIKKKTCNGQRRVVKLLLLRIEVPSDLIHQLRS